MFTLTIALLCSLPAFASSLVPQKSVALAAYTSAYVLWDNTTTHITAFDINDVMMGIYRVDEFLAASLPAGTCSPLNASLAQEYSSLPFYPEMQLYARRHRAFDGWLLPTDPQSIQPTAFSCIDPGPFPIFANGTSCRGRGVSRGYPKGGKTTVTIDWQSGWTTTASLNTTTAASLSPGITTTTAFTIPGIGARSVNATASVEVTNQVGKSFTAETSLETSHSMVFENVPADSYCILSFYITSCHAQASARVKFVASGLFWAVKDRPSIWIGINTNRFAEWKRSTYMDVAGTLQGDTSSDFNAECGP